MVFCHEVNGVLWIVRDSMKSLRVIPGSTRIRSKFNVHSDSNPLATLEIQDWWNAA